MTKPSRSCSKGRLAFSGSSLRVESVLAAPKLAKPKMCIRDRSKTNKHLIKVVTKVGTEEVFVGKFIVVSLNGNNEMIEEA